MNNQLLCFFDGIKLRIKKENYLDEVLANADLYSLKKTTNEFDQVEGYRSNLKNFNLFVRRSWKTGEFESIIKGSLHYLSNDNEHNADHFNFPRLKTSIQTLENTFHFQGAETEMINLEVGMNLCLQIDSMSDYDIIKNILYVGKKPLKQKRIREEYSGSGISYCEEHDRYYLKIYCKSCQFSKITGGKIVIRVEVKYKKSCIIRDNGIHCLPDLLIKENQDKISQHLKRYFSKLIIFQPEILRAPISTKEKEFLLAHAQPCQWESLEATCFKKSRLKYLEIIDKYCPVNITKLILASIQDQL